MDARGKLNVAVEWDLEWNDHVSRLERDISLLKDQLAAKAKKVEILQQDSAAKSAEVKKLEDKVARLEAEKSHVETIAVEAFKQSAK